LGATADIRKCLVANSMSIIDADRTIGAFVRYRTDSMLP